MKEDDHLNEDNHDASDSNEAARALDDDGGDTTNNNISYNSDNKQLLQNHYEQNDGGDDDDDENWSEEERQARVTQMIWDQVKRTLESGCICFGGWLWDDDEDVVLAQFGQYLNVATILLPTTRIRDFVSISYWGEDEVEPPEMSTESLDAFFQELAKKKNLKHLSVNRLHRQELLSLTQQLSPHQAFERLNTLCWTLGLDDPASLDIQGFAGKIARKCKKIRFSVESFRPLGAPMVPDKLNRERQVYQSFLQEIGCELRQVSIRDGEDVTLIFSRLHGSNLHLLTETTVLDDVPCVKFEIDYSWSGESLQPFSQVPSLNLRLRSVFESISALSAKRRDMISNNIRDCIHLRELTIEGSSPGCVDLIRSVAAGMDKNTSIRQLKICDSIAGLNSILWTALSKNENTRLMKLELAWNEQEAGLLWNGLLSNKSVYRLIFSRSHRMDLDSVMNQYQLELPFHALTKRNKVLRKTEKFCRKEQNAKSFMDKLCELSQESTTYPGTCSISVQEQDQNDLQPANFSACYIAIRRHFPHFVHKEIVTKLPLKDATDEDLRTLDLDAYGDVCNTEPPDVQKRVWNELKRRNREMDRRIRELESRITIYEPRM
eukprot:scaffold2791_cov154-Amphora_coffeaeformis.AAC.4